MVDRGIFVCREATLRRKERKDEHESPQDGTVLGLLRELGHDPQRVAVEKNGSIVPRAAFAEEKLTDADHLEVVCFVGGG